jgi:hypothetical protein
MCRRPLSVESLVEAPPQSNADGASSQQVADADEDTVINAVPRHELPSSKVDALMEIFRGACILAIIWVVIM